MNMPDGWKRLKFHEVCMDPIACEQELEKAAIIVKGLAESLEQIYSDPTRGLTNTERDKLEKFKNWK